MSIGIAILLVVAVGLVCAIMLTIASKVFFVPVDETAAALREVLPGANCGGCGFAGCDDYANTMAADRTTPCNKCPVGGASVAAKLAGDKYRGGGGGIPWRPRNQRPQEENGFLRGQGSLAAQLGTAWSQRRGENRR